MLLQPLSLASSADVQEDKIPPVGSSHLMSQSSNFPPVTSTPEGRAQENLDTVESPQGHSIFRKWLQSMTKRGPTSPKPRRLSGKSREPADPQAPSHSPARVNATNEGPSWMAAGRPKAVSAVP